MTELATELKKLLCEFNPKDIFNADETGLYFRLLPDKNLDFQIVMVENASKTDLLFSSAPICQALKRYLCTS